MPCFYVSTEGLNDLIDAGWILRSGPYVTEEECLANCTSSSSSSDLSSSSSSESKDWYCIILPSSSSGGVCPECTASKFTMEVEGITNVACDQCATWFNGVFELLGPYAAPDYCQYRSELLDMLECFPDIGLPDAPIWFINYYPATNSATLWVAGGGANTTWECTDFNCCSGGVFTLDTSDTTQCANWPTTITLIGNGSDCASTTCEFCPTGKGADFTFTVSGVTDNTCGDCELPNGTWTVVSTTDSDNECIWDSSSNIIDMCNDEYIWALYHTISGTTLLRLETLVGQIPMVTYEYTEGWNCQSPLTLTFSSAGNQCQNWPSSISIS